MLVSSSATNHSPHISVRSVGVVSIKVVLGRTDLEAGGGAAEGACNWRPEASGMRLSCTT
jgi:hypothetical protein